MHAYILTSVYMSPTYQPKCWSRTHVWVITCVCKYIYSHSISLHAQMHVQLVCIKSCMNVHIYTCTRTELHANIMRGTYLRSMHEYIQGQPAKPACHRNLHRKLSMASMCMQICRDRQAYSCHQTKHMKVSRLCCFDAGDYVCPVAGSTDHEQAPRPVSPDDSAEDCIRLGLWVCKALWFKARRVEEFRFWVAHLTWFGWVGGEGYCGCIGVSMFDICGLRMHELPIGSFRTWGYLILGSF